MTPQRWKEVEAAFEQARDLPAAQRNAFLAQHANGDDELRQEVASLLESHERAGDFIDDPSLFFSADELQEAGSGVGAGRLIRPYRVLRAIGRGGMGAVYLAERADDQYQKQVAIKLIKRGMDSDSVLRQFRNERQILASFDHLNIARLFDGGTTDDGLPYFVMEYVEGIAIDKYCDEKKLALADRLKVFREVCAAVSYAHRRAVIHRDLKPSNILITGEGVPKLLDFGIAKILQADAADGLMTVAGVRAMTPEYASPEQVRGDPLTTASDVYSLGVILYQLLTGELPYSLRSKSPADITRAITDTDPKRPSTVVTCGNREATTDNRNLLRGDLDNILLMALRKEPARRYQSMEEFSEDIGRHLAARPVVARRDTFGYRTSKFIQRNAVATAAAGLVLLTLVAGLIATTWEARRARRQEVRAERRFDDVRQLAHSVLFDYHDAIKDLPGATRVRERLVQDALIYLDRLARDSSGDPRLQRELAAAYERVGDVRGRAFAASLGDMAGAMDSYVKALQIREAIVSASPHDAESRRDLAGSYLRIGVQLIHTNDARRGTDYLRQALDSYLRLRAEQPGNAQIAHELAGAYNELGLALEDWWGDTAAALKNHREALALREEFVATEPRSQTNRRDLSASYLNIGRALAVSGDTQGALESNQKALELSATLFHENPTNADYRRKLAISYQNDGNYRAALDDISGALQSFREKLALDEQSLNDDPVNAQTREDLAYSYERIADLLAASGEHLPALSHYSKAAKMYEEVLAVEPEILRVHYRVIFAHLGMGEMQTKARDPAAALAEGAKANKLLSEAPFDPSLRWQAGMRGELYRRLAGIFAELAVENIPLAEQRQRWSMARRIYHQSLEVWQDMEKRGMLNGGYAGKLDDVTREIAKCDVALAEK